MRADQQSIMGAKRIDYQAQGFAIHCTRYTEQQGVGTVSMAEPLEVTVGNQNPGNNQNFLSADFFALVRGNHVLSMSAGKNAGSLRTYLHALFRNANFADELTMFDIVRVPAANQLARIVQAGGVEAVQLDLTIEEATLGVVNGVPQAHDTMWKKLVDPLRSAVAAIVAADEKASAIADSRKGKMRLTVNVPGGDLAAAKNGIDGIAEGIVADEEASDFVIRLRNGESINPSEIAVKRRVTVDRMANTVVTDQVFSEMVTYMADLEAIGQLDA